MEQITKEQPVNVGNEVTSATDNVKDNLTRWWIWHMTKVLGVSLCVVYVAVPIVLRFFPHLILHAIFLNHVIWPPFIDLNHPQDFRLSGTRVFHVETEPGVTVGVWQLLPKSLIPVMKNSEKYFQNVLADDRPVVLYLHGNAGTRAGWHRVQLYKVIQDMDYHVITFDYRGYGDSSGWPSEDGLCHDAKFIYKLLKEKTKQSKLVIWGHSLGSAVATRVSKELCEEGACPDKLVLEAPFNNVIDVATNHPLSTPYRMLPNFQTLFVDPVLRHGVKFNTEERIKSVSSPILILHAKDDKIVPIPLGEKVYTSASTDRDKRFGQVKFVVFEEGHRYGHKHIHAAPELPDIVRDFVEDRSVVSKVLDNVSKTVQKFVSEKGKGILYYS